MKSSTSSTCGLKGMLPAARSENSNTTSANTRALKVNAERLLIIQFCFLVNWEKEKVVTIFQRL